MLESCRIGMALILRAPLCGANNTSKTDVAPWCYNWVMGWMDWISPGGVKYRAPYGANKRHLISMFAIIKNH